MAVQVYLLTANVKEIKNIGQAQKYFIYLYKL
jgi:hypothetical protein